MESVSIEAYLQKFYVYVVQYDAVKFIYWRSPCNAILNKQNVIFFFYKIGEQEGRTSSGGGGLVPMAGGRSGERV
jgi:hypothetical protein